MRKWISLLLAVLLAAACLQAAGEAAEDEIAGLPEEATDAEALGDDSGLIPIEHLPEQGGTDGEDAGLMIRPLKTGDEGDDVTFLQMRLKNLDYYTGEATGKFSGETAEAVKAFQRDYRGKGLEVTGEADITTQLILAGATYRTLRRGMSGEDVKELQERLIALGYYKGKASGDFLEGTQNGIKQFQKYNGMEQTGVADPALLEVIYSENAVSRYGDEEIEDGPVDFDDQYYLVDENENGVPMPNAPVVFTEKLKRGIKGSEAVKQMQERMAQLGYYDGPVSGNFMDKTVAAVKKIQVQNGMEETGVVDEDTWNVIFNSPGIVMPDMTPKPAPKTEFALTVDVKNQIVIVYTLDENNEYTVPVRYMLCSTGMKATPSPVGDWVLNGRKTRWCYFPKWGSYARYWTRINAQVAFHSPIYRSADTGTMNVSSYKALGQRASHGCIRLSVEDAKWVYENVGKGTVVTITEDLPVNQELKTALMRDKPSSPNADPPETTPEPEYSAANKPEIKGTLGAKRSGPEVYWVQRRLQELGYYTTKCTGQMLNQTQEAVRQFQKDHGIYPSGTVDSELIDLLAEADKITPTPAPTAPEPTPAP